MKVMTWLIVASTLCFPFTVRAASITVPITYPANSNFVSVLSNPFAQFNPSFGILDSYSLTVAGTVTSSDPFPPDIAFKAPVTFDTILELVAGAGGAISGTGSTSNSGDLAGVTGTGTAQFLAQDFSNRGGVTSINFTTDDITYNYTPRLPVPEPSSLALLGAGLVGLAFRHRRKSFQYVVGRGSTRGSSGVA